MQSSSSSSERDSRLARTRRFHSCMGVHGSESTDWESRDEMSSSSSNNRLKTGNSSLSLDIKEGEKKSKSWIFISKHKRGTRNSKSWISNLKLYSLSYLFGIGIHFSRKNALPLSLHYLRTENLFNVMGNDEKLEPNFFHPIEG